MKAIKILPVLFAVLFFFNTVFAQQDSKVGNASDVINKAIDAMGGRDYLSSIKTLYTEIATEMEGRQVIWVTKEMLPNKGAFQIVYNDRIVFENWFDGKKGYEVVNGEKRKADDEEFKDKKYKKNIINEFDYLDSSLWKLELIGEEKYAQEDCYKIRATLINDEVIELYYSKKTFYLLRQDKIKNGEKNSFSSVFYSDYKNFGGYTTSASISFGSEGQIQTGKVISVVVNKKISDKDFK